MNRGEESSNRRAVVETMDTEVRREESSNLRAVLKTMDTVVRGEENIFGYRSQGRLILKLINSCSCYVVPEKICEI